MKRNERSNKRSEGTKGAEKQRAVKQKERRNKRSEETKGTEKQKERGEKAAE